MPARTGRSTRVFPCACLPPITLTVRLCPACLTIRESLVGSKMPVNFHTRGMCGPKSRPGHPLRLINGLFRLIARNTIWKPFPETMVSLLCDLQNGSWFGKASRQRLVYGVLNASTLAKPHHCLYGHAHSTRGAWVGPGEIRIGPPVALSAHALRRFNRKQE